MEELSTLLNKDFNHLSAKDFSFLVCSHLNNGILIKEFPVPDRGDGRSGRVDLIYKKRNKTIAFEFDRLIPRKKSIFKLKSLTVDEKYVITRSPFAIHSI